MLRPKMAGRGPEGSAWGFGPGYRERNTDDWQYSNSEIVECLQFFDCSFLEFLLWQREQLDLSGYFSRVHHAILVSAIQSN